MGQSPQNTSPKNRNNNTAPNALTNNDPPEEFFAFIKCPQCKDHTLMQTSKTSVKCHSCGYSHRVELAQKEQSSGDSLKGFSSMVAIAVTLITLLLSIVMSGNNNPSFAEPEPPRYDHRQPVQ